MLSTRLGAHCQLPSRARIILNVGETSVIEIIDLDTTAGINSRFSLCQRFAIGARKLSLPCVLPYLPFKKSHRRGFVGGFTAPPQSSRHKRIAVSSWGGSPRTDRRFRYFARLTIAQRGVRPVSAGNLPGRLSPIPGNARRIKPRL